MPLDENAMFDAALAASLLRVNETEREQIQVLWIAGQAVASTVVTSALSSISPGYFSGAFRGASTEVFLLQPLVDRRIFTERLPDVAQP